jgi:hypothetical protein
MKTIKYLLIVAVVFLFACPLYAQQNKAEMALEVENAIIKAKNAKLEAENAALRAAEGAKLQNAKEKEGLIKLFDDTDNLYYDPKNEVSVSKIRTNSVLEGEVRRFFSLFEKKYPGVYLKIGRVRMSSNVSDAILARVMIDYYPNPPAPFPLGSLEIRELVHNFVISEGDAETRRVFAAVTAHGQATGSLVYLINDAFEPERGGKEVKEQYTRLLKQSEGWEY